MDENPHVDGRYKSHFTVIITPFKQYSLFSYGIFAEYSVLMGSSSLLIGVGPIITVRLNLTLLLSVLSIQEKRIAPRKRRRLVL